MWFTIVSIIYVLVCAFLILVVLLQQGKGGGVGSAFGGSTQTVFGGSGAGNFLTRLTAIAATLFMLLSAALAYMSSSGDRVIRGAEEVEARQAEASARAAGEDGEAAGAAAAPSEDTPEEAANDDALDALEQAVQEQVQGEAEAAPAEGDEEEAAPAADGEAAPAAEPAPQEPAAAEAPAAE